MNTVLRTAACLTVLGFLSVPAMAAPRACAAKSGAHTVALLELYTSEGCSSCPPAERWLSGLRDSQAKAGKVVPLALHVGYWDYLGWKDPYAQPDFARRQHDLVQQAGEHVVYTPQVFVQGRPYRIPDSAAEFAAHTDAIYGRTPEAELGVVLQPVRDGKLQASVSADLRKASAGVPTRLVVALYENGLTSQIRAGENRGATLHHDFVVRRWLTPKAVPASGHLEETVTVELPDGRPVADFGLAAFVENTRSGEVLQAISRQVCP